MNFRSQSYAFLCCIVTLFVNGQALGEDSRQWGGNDLGRNMYSAEINLPTTFRPGKLRERSEDFDPKLAKNVKWIAKLGSQSFSSPAISGGKVFIGTNNDSPRNRRDEGDRSILMCFEEQSGKFLWQLVVPKLAAGKVNDWENLGLTITPAVEGNRVYLSTSRGEVLCLTTEGLGAGNVGPFLDEAQYIAGPGRKPVKTTETDADIVWRYDMIDELGVFPHNNTRSQVLLIGDFLYLTTCNGQDWTHSNIPSPASPSLIVLNKRTGKLTALDHADISRNIFHGQWSGPSGGKVSGRQLIFYGGGDGICYAFDAQPVEDDGEQILPVVWSMDCNPIKYRYNLGLDVFKPIRYPTPEGPSEIVGSPVSWRNRVYVAIGQDPEHGEGLGNLVCLDATKRGGTTGGNIFWESDKIARSMSTAAITPDGLLFITDFSGVLYCFDAFFGQLFWKRDLKAHVWCSPFVADGKVYIGNEDGDFRVFAATPREKLLHEVNFEAPIYSTAVAANGVLYINSISHLFAFEEKNGPSDKGEVDP
jgi:outer membrane protein assembly factor BamB